MKNLKQIFSPSGSIFGTRSRTFTLRASFNCSQSLPVSPNNEEHQLFNYTSGRWLYDEQLQLQKRQVEFNVQALKQVASQTLGTRCTNISKLPEGLYNKVFSLHMDNGHEILARIPNPNAGNSRYVVSSEVATLDFVSPPSPAIRCTMGGLTLTIYWLALASQCSRHSRFKGR